MILGLHIAGGILAILASVAATYAVAFNKPLGWAKLSMPILASWQVVTGVFLVLMGGSLIRTCVTGLVYLSLMGVVYLRVVRYETVEDL